MKPNYSKGLIDKEKLKFLPICLFAAFPSLCFMFFFLYGALDLSLKYAIPFSILYYFEIALYDSKVDYLEDKIDKLRKGDSSLK